jgi:hypothetical protein
MAQTHEIAVPDTPQLVARATDRDICDSYLYLLGRILIARQQQLELKQGFRWNRLVHRDPGAWGNHNLDVATSEAWLAVDETSCTILDVPRIVGRYYTIHVLDPWGETITNINERTYPAHPSGLFAFCLRGLPIGLPLGTQRIDLPSKTARAFIRIELGDDPKAASLLQHRITLRATGTPRVPPTHVPAFTTDMLPSVEVFDATVGLLAEPDGCPLAEPLRAKTRIVAAAAADKHERSRLDEVIRHQAWRELEQAIGALTGDSNGWAHPKLAGRYGRDWLSRTAANLVARWSNDRDEMMAFVTDPIDGAGSYTLTFPASSLPGAHVTYMWSVSCVDAIDHRLVANAMNRYAIGTHSRLVFGGDGSLTLYFGPTPPRDAPQDNWLPTPGDKPCVLTWRSYGPDEATTSGVWAPSALVKR